MSDQRTSLPGLLKWVVSESLSDHSDQQLLERLTQVGDEAAFAAILDRHGSMLLGLCRRLVRDAHLADDILQATFLVLAQKASSIRRRDRLVGWLYGVAHRIARQARLAEAARARREMQVASARGEASAPEASWNDLLRILDEELQRLPERQRLPLLLCYLEGRTQDEAAKQLGWSLSTVRRRLDEGRDLLRARIAAHGATLGAGLVAGFLAGPETRATLTPDLRRAVLTTALDGAKSGVVPASIAALVKGSVPMISFVRIVLWAGIAVVLTGTLVGVVWQSVSALEVKEPSAESPAAVSPGPVPEPDGGVQDRKQVPRHDRFNDPLPKGAVARLGTVAYRHGRNSWLGSLTYTADGKDLISTGGSWVRRWSIATGQANVNLGDGGRTDDGIGIGGLVTPDGKLLLVGESVPLARGITWQCTELDLESGKERTYRLEFPRNTQTAHALPGFLSPDGKTFAELTGDGRLTLWNAADGTFTHFIKLERVNFTALAFTPDGKTTVVGDDTHNLRVFELSTGKELRSFGNLNAKAVLQMAISPDGQWLATVGGERRPGFRFPPTDRFVRLWDLQQGSEVRTLEFAEDGGFQSLLFTADSRAVIAGIRGGKKGAPAAVRTWDVASGKPGRAWTDDPTIGLTLGVRPDGKELATMNDDGVIRFWDMATGRELRAQDASPQSLDAVCFRPDGKTLWTVGGDGALREWDAATGRLLGPPLRRVEGSYPSFAAGGRLMLTNFYPDDRNGLVRLQDSATGRVLLEQQGFSGVVRSDGKRFAIRDDHPQVFDVTTGGALLTPGLSEAELKSAWPHRLIPRGFTPDGESLILCGETVSVWDLRTGKRKSSWSLVKNNLLTKADEKTQPYSWERVESGPAVSPDGHLLAYSLLKDKDRTRERSRRDWFSQVVILETATGKLLRRTDIDSDSYREIIFSPDGTLVAAGGSWTIRVWDVTTGKELWTFEGHRGAVKSLAFSPDGKRLASASEDSTVLIWDVSR